MQSVLPTALWRAEPKGPPPVLRTQYLNRCLLHPAAHRKAGCLAGHDCPLGFPGTRVHVSYCHKMLQPATGLCSKQGHLTCHIWARSSELTRSAHRPTACHRHAAPPATATPLPLLAPGPFLSWLPARGADDPAGCSPPAVPALAAAWLESARLAACTAEACCAACTSRVAAAAAAAEALASSLRAAAAAAAASPPPSAHHRARAMSSLPRPACRMAASTFSS